MPSFTITKHGNTYEFTIPEPEYEVCSDVIDKINEGELRVEYNPLVIWDILENADAQDAYMRYVITKLWSKVEYDIVEALVEDYLTAEGDLPAFLEDFVDWSDVWERGVVEELPEPNDIREDECLLALRKIMDNIEEEEKRVREEKRKEEEAKKKNAPTIQMLLAHLKSLSPEEQAGFQKQYDEARKTLA